MSTTVETAMGQAAAAPEAAAPEGTLLLGWLRLLGWTIEVERDAGGWSGLACHAGEAGDEIRVAATAESHGALAWQLFRGAIGGLERRGDHARRAA